MHALQDVTCFNERFQVAGDGAGIAGDEDDLQSSVIDINWNY
jgi:hypothetical protein